MKIRLALVFVLGSYIAWQEYQRQSVTMIGIESLPGVGEAPGSASAELWSSGAQGSGSRQ